jgi:hypothetical protein
MHGERIPAKKRPLRHHLWMDTKNTLTILAAVLHGKLSTTDDSKIVATPP